MLLGGAAIAGVSAAANAALVIDVVATSANGGAVLVNGKNVNILAATPGAVITFDIFADTTGSNGNTQDDGILSFAGSFLSEGGAARGNLVATRAASMTGTGGSNGLVTDLDGDGDLDVGSNNNASASNFFSARSSTAPNPVFGPHVLVGTMSMTLGAPASGGNTLVNFRPRVSSTAGSWFEDGTQITSSAFSAGAPVTLIVPEPTTLGLAGVAGLGLLARRRKD
jgi:hypothetical protein